MDKQAAQAALKRLRSDWKDCNNPELVKIYPHLGNQELIKQIENEIHYLENLFPNIGFGP